MCAVIIGCSSSELLYGKAEPDFVEASYAGGAQGCHSLAQEIAVLTATNETLPRRASFPANGDVQY
jgi:hypothetical protein